MHPTIIIISISLSEIISCYNIILRICYYKTTCVMDWDKDLQLGLR